jgi:hypothetical protein
MSGEDSLVLSMGQEADDRQFVVKASSPTVDEGSDKAAEDPSTLN